MGKQGSDGHAVALKTQVIHTDKKMSKEAKKRAKLLKKQWNEEINILKRIADEHHSCEFIVMILGYWREKSKKWAWGKKGKKGKKWAVMEYLSDGSLKNWLEKKSGSDDLTRSKGICCTIVYHIAKGLALLKGMGIIHRDIAARNIMVQLDERNTKIKVIILDTDIILIQPQR